MKLIALSILTLAPLGCAPGPGIRQHEAAAKVEPSSTASVHSQNHAPEDPSSPFQSLDEASSVRRLRWHVLDLSELTAQQPDASLVEVRGQLLRPEPVCEFVDTVFAHLATYEAAGLMGAGNELVLASGSSADLMWAGGNLGTLRVWGVDRRWVVGLDLPGEPVRLCPLKGGADCALFEGADGRHLAVRLLD